jgi:L-amino acid N-acyltransferase YncA
LERSQRPFCRNSAPDAKISFSLRGTPMNKPITLRDLREEVTFRFATGDDLSELMELYRLFYEEAVYKDYLEYDSERVRATVFGGIISDERPHILAIVDESIVGFISYWFDHTFSKAPCMVLLELYVHPDFRRSAIGRGLVGVSIQEGARQGAGAFHAPVASGMKEVRTLHNLFAKAGFMPFGVMFRRRL